MSDLILVKQQKLSLTVKYDSWKLKLALLPPLLLVSDTFDVVIIVGALDAGFVPVCVVRELCHAAKPGKQLTTVSSARTERDTKHSLSLCGCFPLLLSFLVSLVALSVFEVIFMFLVVLNLLLVLLIGFTEDLVQGLWACTQ